MSISKSVRNISSIGFLLLFFCLTCKLSVSLASTQLQLKKAPHKSKRIILKRLENAPKFYLLTSLKIDEGKNGIMGFLRGRNWRISEKLQKYFLKKFPEVNLQIEAIHSATAMDLSEVLTSSETYGLLWISHASSPPELGKTIFDQGIFDSNGADLTIIFERIHPNIKFLGINACYSNFLIKNHINSFGPDTNPGLVVFGFDKKISPKKGIRKIMRAFEPETYLNRSEYCSDKRGIPIKIQRTVPHHFKNKPNHAIAIKIGKKLVKTISLKQIKETEEITVYLPIDKIENKNSFKVIFSLIAPSEHSHFLGKIKISFDQDSNDQDLNKWKLLTIDNEPIGVNSRIFKYKGSYFKNGSEKLIPVRYRPFDCKQ